MYNLTIIQNNHMSSIPPVSIPDIIKRRAHKSSHRQIEPIHNLSQKSFTIEKNVSQLYNELLSKLEDGQTLTTGDKADIVDIISDKYQTSYNRNTMTQSMSIGIYDQIHLLERTQTRLKNSYFVLKGRTIVYLWHKHQNSSKNQKHAENITTKDSTTNHNSQQEEIFDNIADFQQKYSGYTGKQVIESLMGFGPLFNPAKQIVKLILLVDTNSVVAKIKNNQFEGSLVNYGGIDMTAKKQILQSFPILRSVGRKISNVMSFFELKKYNRSDYIYKINTVPTHFYLLVKGQVVFDSHLNSEDKKSKQQKSFRSSFHNSGNNGISIRSSLSRIKVTTQSIYQGNYFGQEELLTNSNRKYSVRCQSAHCYTLQLPRDKFMKLIEYGDFQEDLKKGACIKKTQRDIKLNKANQINANFEKETQKEAHFQPFSQAENGLVGGKMPYRKSEKMNKKTRIMHGVLIRSYEGVKTQQDVKFSMLEVNRDMFQSTQKKFRKYTMKPKQKIKPQVNWNLKRVWKVLNLESVLRQQSELVGADGKKFYENHLRYLNHINECKSLRPKTSSSTYRTKLQYIAYLQQFSSEKQTKF